MTATVAAARQQGKLAVFHSRDLEAVTHAVEAGASGFVHVPVDEVPGEDLIGLMLKNDIFFTPNLSLARHEASRLLEDPNFGSLLQESEIKNLGDWRAMRNDDGDEIEYTTVIRLHEAGIPILVGSDMPNAGTIAGATVHAELELLVEAGMTPIDALRAATSSPASAYGFTDRGRIAPGMVADLVMVEGKPVETITDSRRIVTIWRSGTVHVPDN
jgi:imidazolonepropionase-like amidohydrolase